MIANFLCWLGLHRWRFLRAEDVTVTYVETDYKVCHVKAQILKCRNPLCGIEKVRTLKA